jgi:hypothetical protein
MRIADSRAVRVAVAFFLVVSMSGAVPGGFATAAAGSTQPPPSNVSAQLVLRAYDVLDKQAHRPGADPSDIAFQAGRLGFDATRIFAFVRDQTRLEPYRGMLRGARGVLAGRAGNALDRSLLLQALLTESGIPCRLMQGQLSDTTARQALQEFLSPSNPAPPAPPDDSQQPSAEKLLAQAGLPDSLIAQIRERSATETTAFWRSVSPQADERATYLAGLLDAGGLKPAKAKAVQDVLVDSLKTHYWVQVQDKAKRWVDLDPLMASSQPGQTFGRNGRPAGDVPASQRHQLDFSLVYRTKQGGATKEEVLLQATADAADAPFKPMAFAVQSAERDLPSAAGMTGAQKVDLLRRMKKFQGTFRAGSEMKAGKPFDLAGNTYDVEPGGVIGNATGIGKGAVSGFGGFGGALGGGGGTPKPQKAFVDLRVVMTLRSPGRPAETQTRVLVTAEHPEPPLLNWEVYLQPAPTPSKLLAYQLTDYLARQRPFVEALFAPKPGAWPTPDPWPFPIYAASMATLRNSALARTMGGEAAAGVVPLMDHPNLFLTNHAIRINDAGTTTEARWGVDLVDMGINFVPKAAKDEPAAMKLALKQGVEESTIEGVFLSRAFPSAGVSSAAGRFDMARAAGAAVKVVRPRDAAALKALGWADADAQALASAEPASQLVVAATAAPNEPPAWWTVAPDGTAVARSRGGRGEADTDYLELQMDIVSKTLCFFDMLSAGKNAHEMLAFMICAGMTSTDIALKMLEVEEALLPMAIADLVIWAGMKSTAPSED